MKSILILIYHWGNFVYQKWNVTHQRTMSVILYKHFWLILTYFCFVCVTSVDTIKVTKQEKQDQNCFLQNHETQIEQSFNSLPTIFREQILIKMKLIHSRKYGEELALCKVAWFSEHFDLHRRFLLGFFLSCKANYFR